MSNEDDIPVLRDAVAGKTAATIDQERLDSISDNLSIQARELLDELLIEGLREAEESLRRSIGNRLNDELPTLIDNVLREQLGKDS